MPKTGELLARIQAVANDPVGISLAAWDEVLAALRTYSKPRLGELAARGLRVIGGLERVGRAKIGWELDKLRAQFLEAVQPHANTAVLPALSAPTQQDDCAD